MFLRFVPKSIIAQVSQQRLRFQLERNFIRHQFNMRNVMAFLREEGADQQSGEYGHDTKTRVNLFGDADLVLPPFYKIFAAQTAWWRNGTSYLPNAAENYMHRPYPEQRLLEKLIKAHYAKQGVVGEVTMSYASIDNLFQYLCKHLLTPGDIMLSSSPIYGQFFNVIQEHRAKLYLIKTTAATHFKFTATQLKEMLEAVPEAKAFLWVHPDNPTGACYTEVECRALATVFVEFNQKRQRNNMPPLYVIIDPVICHLVHVGNDKFVQLAAMPGMQDFTVVLTSLTKDQSRDLYFSYMIGPPQLITAIKERYERRRAAIAELMGLVELFLPENQVELAEHYAVAMELYQHNLILLEQKLAQFNDLFQQAVTLRIVLKPAAGFQLLLQINGIVGANYPADYQPADYVSPHSIQTSLDFTAFFKKMGRIEVIPGEGFDLAGDLMLFRMSLSKKPLWIHYFFQDLIKTIRALKPELTLDPDLLAQTNSITPTVNDGLDFNFHTYHHKITQTANNIERAKHIGRTMAKL